MKKLLLIAMSTIVFQSQYAFADAPVAVNTVAPIEDVTFEVDTQIEKLSKALQDSDGFEDNKGGEIRQSFGLLACLGQALAEHKDAGNSKIQGAAMRDAALTYNRKGTLDEAKASFEKVKIAYEGKATGEATKEHPWNKLINMHPMMEEINSRNSDLLKVLRRPRGKPNEPVHATTWVILGLAMKADTHEVKNKDDLPEWNKHADAFIEASTKLAAAIRAKNKTEGRKWFDAANESCDACHEKFQ